MTVTALDPDRRIAVTAITGFLGSGKTRYINELLQQPDFANTVVIVNEIGQLGIDQANWSFVQPSVILLEGGCLCCQMQGSMSATLQRLFTDAVAHRIPRFDHILVETSGLADPSALRFTLHSDFFLKERFVYKGCICIVDVVNAAKQAAYTEWARQVVLADLILFSRTDMAQAGMIRQCHEVLATLTDAPVLEIPQFFSQGKAGETLKALSVLPLSGNGIGVGRFVPRPAADFQGFCTDRAQDETPSGQAGAIGTLSEQANPVSQSQLRPLQRHSPIRVITLGLLQPFRRSAFNREFDAMLARLGPALIRAKALLRFDKDPNLYLFNVVHTQRYPAQRLPLAPHSETKTGIVLFLDGITDEGALPTTDDFYRNVP